MAIIKIDGCKCNRCGYIWAPKNREELPVICAKCKSARWNKDERIKRNK